MAIKGYWENGYYIPELTVQRFEIELGKWIAARSCDGCGRRLGSDPRRIINHRHYHQQCAPR